MIFYAALVIILSLSFGFTGYLFFRVSECLEEKKDAGIVWDRSVRFLFVFAAILIYFLVTLFFSSNPIKVWLALLGSITPGIFTGWLITMWRKKHPNEDGF